MENPSEIVKTVLLDQDGSVITSGYVTRTVNVPTRMRIPVIRNGAPLPPEELEALGVTVRNYTQEELDAERCAALLAGNPDLQRRVRQYAELTGRLHVAADADSDTITAAIAQSDLTDAEKTAAAAAFLTLIHDIEVNYNEVDPGNGLAAWSVLDKLIRHLPDEPKEHEAL